jgi:hypothetical protein
MSSCGPSDGGLSKREPRRFIAFRNPHHAQSAPFSHFRHIGVVLFSYTTFTGGQAHE